ncbi:hypothetical protein [Pseudomonas sp. SMN5]|uniref:hypothetical protein n=1 Tax=Pseudomonas sp. SMN5 TaxID=3390198 RepID=UPI003F850036
MKYEDVLVVGGPRSKETVSVLEGMNLMRSGDPSSDERCVYQYHRREWISNSGEQKSVFVLEGMSDSDSLKIIHEIYGE